MSDNLIHALPRPRTDPTPPDELPRQLHDRLVARASADSVARHRLPHRRLAASASCCSPRPTAASPALAYESEDHDAVLDALADAHRPPDPASTTGVWTTLARAARRLLRRPTAHASTSRSTCASRTASASRCCGHLRDIPFGRTESYAEVAASAGSPRAVRAVGSACATNPCPSSSRATASCAPTAASAATSVDSTPSASCSTSSQPHESVRGLRFEVELRSRLSGRSTSGQHSGIRLVGNGWGRCRV